MPGLCCFSPVTHAQELVKHASYRIVLAFDFAVHGDLILLERMQHPSEPQCVKYFASDPNAEILQRSLSKPCDTL